MCRVVEEERGGRQESRSDGHMLEGEKSFSGWSVHQNHLLQLGLQGPHPQVSDSVALGWDLNFHFQQDPR